MSYSCYGYKSGAKAESKSRVAMGIRLLLPGIRFDFMILRRWKLQT